jgi:hypothetical protein
MRESVNAVRTMARSPPSTAERKRRVPGYSQPPAAVEGSEFRFGNPEDAFFDPGGGVVASGSRRMGEARKGRAAWITFWEQQDSGLFS